MAAVVLVVGSPLLARCAGDSHRDSAICHIVTALLIPVKKVLTSQVSGGFCRESLGGWRRTEGEA